MFTPVLFVWQGEWSKLLRSAAVSHSRLPCPTVGCRVPQSAAVSHSWLPCPIQCLKLCRDAFQGSIQHHGVISSDTLTDIITVFICCVCLGSCISWTASQRHLFCRTASRLWPDCGQSEHSGRRVDTGRRWNGTSTSTTALISGWIRPIAGWASDWWGLGKFVTDRFWCLYHWVIVIVSAFTHCCLLAGVWNCWWCWLI